MSYTKEESKFINEYARSNEVGRKKLVKDNPELFKSAYRKVKDKKSTSKTFTFSEFAFLENISLSNIKRRIQNGELTVAGKQGKKNTINRERAELYYSVCKPGRAITDKRFGYNLTQSEQAILKAANAIVSKKGGKSKKEDIEKLKKQFTESKSRISSQSMVAPAKKKPGRKPSRKK